jgi:hypothetical protein
MLIKNIQEFKMAMQKYHLDKPKLSLNFDDSLSDEIKELWRDMDKAILKLIWEINKCK